jgi:hypothetical protein
MHTHFSLEPSRDKQRNAQSLQNAGGLAL